MVEFFLEILLDLFGNILFGLFGWALVWLAAVMVLDWSLCQLAFFGVENELGQTAMLLAPFALSFVIYNVFHRRKRWAD